jgi:hypothetical protein
MNLQKDIINAYDSIVTYKQWKIQFDKQIMAKTKCGKLKTLDEVYELCNPEDPFVVPRCNLPVTFQCGPEEIRSIVNLNAFGSSSHLSLSPAPPAAMPLVKLLMDAPSLPTYNLFKNMEARNDTLAFIAQTSTTWTFLGRTETVDYSGGINLESCSGGSFAIGEDCEACDYELVDAATSQPVMAVAADAHPLPCQLDDVRAFRDALNTTIYKLQTANSDAEFAKGINTLNLVANMDGFVGCEAAIGSIITSAPVATEVTGVRGCFADYMSPDFMADPCCNTTLQFEQCCAARTVTMNVTELQGVNYTAINTTVPAGAGDQWTQGKGYVPGPTRQFMLNAAVNALSEFVQAERANDDSQYGCEATLQRAVPTDFLAQTAGFLYECYSIVSGQMTKSGKPSSRCSLDTDCYTSCDQGNKQCAAPTASTALQAYVSCTIDRVSPDVLLYLRDTLRVPAQPEDTFSERLAAGLSDRVTDQLCDGPDEYAVGACLLTTSPAACDRLSESFPDSDAALPELTVVSLVDSEGADSADSAPTPDRSSDPYANYQYIFVRKDLTSRAACIDASLQWVNVSFGDQAPIPVCRVPVWYANTSGTSTEGRDEFDRPSSLRPGLRSRPRRVRSPAWVREHSAGKPRALFKHSVHARKAKTVRQSRDGSGSESSDDSSDDSNDNESSDYNSSAVPSVGRFADFDCLQRRDAQIDPCSMYEDDESQWMACAHTNYYTKVCGGLPDPENMFDPFDPATLCTTISNQMRYSVLSDALAGMGNCKVSNFGFSWLSNGYMSGSMIDWHSPLSFYQDQNFEAQPISASGASVAQTRCSQVAESIAAMGVKVTSAKWYQFTSRTESVYDAARDEYVDLTFPGNKTLCEMEKKCSSDSPYSMTHGKAQCLEMSQVHALNRGAFH